MSAEGSIRPLSRGIQRRTNLVQSNNRRDSSVRLDSALSNNSQKKNILDSGKQF